MYRALADSELPGGVPDGGFIFDDVLSEGAGPILDISLQAATLPASCY